MSGAEHEPVAGFSVLGVEHFLSRQTGCGHQPWECTYSYPTLLTVSGLPASFFAPTTPIRCFPQLFDVHMDQLP